MTELPDLLDESWTWLGGSLLAAVVWANAAWFFHQHKQGPVGRAIDQLTTWRFSNGLLQAVRLCFYLGFPFAALVLGHDAVTARFLGLQPLALPGSDESSGSGIAANWGDWLRDAGWAAALGVGSWLVLALAWWWYRRAVMGIGERATVAGSDAAGWTLLREATYHEVHWAFYRNAPILSFGEYWGTWLGLVFIGLEAVLNPAWRHGVNNPQHSPSQWMRVALALVSGALFLQTENLWLATVVHFVVSLGLAALARPNAASGQ